MLTTTYSLITIANEQNMMRRTLRKLQQYIQHTWQELHNIDFGKLEHAFSRLRQFDQAFHERKVELYLIPRIRLASNEADSLLAELDALSVSASKILATVGENLTRRAREGSMLVDELCRAMDLYCQKLLTRLMREEAELLPIARRLFSVEEWFSLAAQFLSDDGPPQGRRWPSAGFIPPAPGGNTSAGLRTH